MYGYPEITYPIYPPVTAEQGAVQGSNAVEEPAQNLRTREEDEDILNYYTEILRNIHPGRPETKSAPLSPTSTKQLIGTGVTTKDKPTTSSALDIELVGGTGYNDNL